MSNPGNFASLMNIATLLLLLSALPLLCFIGYVIINSPIGAPLHKALAERAFAKKNYASAAKGFIKLHDLQANLEGDVYAKKAAQSLELSGNLREARRWYEMAEDWAKLGQLYLEAGQFDEALEIFEKHGLHNRLAQVYELQEQWLKVADIYEKQLKNPHKAEPMYRKALQSEDPETQITAQLSLARLLMAMQRREEAEKFFALAETTLNSSPQYVEFPALWDLHAQVQSSLQPS